MDKRELFISTAKSHISEGNSWACKVTGYSTSGPWCAAFVWACAITAGIQNVIVKCSASASLTLQNSTDAGMGRWLPGPVSGGNPTPQAGDIYALYYGGEGPSRSEFWAGHVGIVIGVTNSSIERIDGNFDGLVKHSTLPRSNSQIRGYFRPDWSRVGVSGTYVDTGSYSGSSGSYSGGVALIQGASQYAATFNSTDALMREIGYMNNKYEPSISSSDVKLSVVNYTQGLSDIVRVAVPAISGVVSTNDNVSSMSGESVTLDADTSGLNNVQKKIIEFFCSKGCQVSAGVAVCANVEQECDYDISTIGDHGTSGGMCQWHNERWTRMVSYVGSNWKTNFQGQLNYLWKELNSSYTSVLTVLTSAKNTLTDAKHATDVFARRFESPYDVNARSRERQKIAARIWNQLYGG